MITMQQPNILFLSYWSLSHLVIILYTSPFCPEICHLRTLPSKARKLQHSILARFNSLKSPNHKILEKSPFLRHRMPLTLPADWEVQSPLPNLWCYQPLPLAAQIQRRFLLVRQNCSLFSHWSKSRVAVMQEQYFNKFLEQRDGVNVA